MKDFMSKVDAWLLREQRDALFVAIDDAEDLAQYGDSETASIRQKHINLLLGLVEVVDAMIKEVK